MSAATPPIPGSGPCPICHETGGFHSRTVHPVEVPAHLLKSGDRLDRYRFTDELYAAAEELLMWGNVYYDQDGKVLRSQGEGAQCRGILAGLAEDADLGPVTYERRLWITTPTERVDTEEAPK